MGDLVKIQTQTQQIQATETSLDIPENLPINDYYEAGTKIHSLHKSTSWLLADLLQYGDSHYGDQFSQVVDDWGYRPETLRNALYVAKRWPKSRRRKELTFAHHQAVSSVDEAVADEMLEIAVKNGYSVKELRVLKREYASQLNDEPEKEEIKSLCPNCGYEL